MGIKNTGIWLSGFMMFLILGSGCGQKNTALIDEAPLISRKFVDDLGRELVMRKPPQKVISLAPNITETIFALGAEHRLAAVSHVCDYPPEAANFPSIVTFPGFDLPGVVLHEPDLVLASSEIHKKNVIQFFDKYNVPMYYQMFSSLDDIYKNILAVGEMLEVKSRATTLVDSLRRIEKGISDSTENQVKYRCMMVMSLDPLVVVGKGSFINEMIEKAGGKNVFNVVDEKYPRVGLEDIKKAQPEYIFFPTRNDQIYSEFIALNPDFHTVLPAALNKRVFIVEPDLVARPGPRIIEGLALLTRILHPRIDVDM